MKCKKLSLMLLSLLLVSSPAFCGWGFLTNSKTKSSALNQSVIQDTGKTNELLEEKTSLKKVERTTSEKATPTTITSEEEKTNLLNYLKNNENGIVKLSQTLTELENSSLLSQNKKISEFRDSLMNLKFNLTNSNLTSESAENLLNSYDEELKACDKEISRVHFGLGTSYTYINEEHGVALDTYLRKHNLYLNGSVGYPIDENTFNTEFNVDKLNYKVGFGYEF